MTSLLSSLKTERINHVCICSKEKKVQPLEMVTPNNMSGCKFRIISMNGSLYGTMSPLSL